MSTTLPPRIPPSCGRRSFLTLAALTTAGTPLLAACTHGAGAQGAGGSGTPARPPASALTDFQELQAHISGHGVAVRVSPLMRVDDTTAALVLELTRAADDAAMSAVQATPPKDGDVLSVGYYLRYSQYGAKPLGANGTRLLDPATKRVWTTTGSRSDSLDLTPGQSVTTVVPFGAVDVDQVTVFVPQTGFVTVRVLSRDDAATAGVDLTDLDRQLPSPAPDPSARRPLHHRNPHPDPGRLHRHAQRRRHRHAHPGLRRHLRH